MCLSKFNICSVQYIRNRLVLSKVLSKVLEDLESRLYSPIKKN